MLGYVILSAVTAVGFFLGTRELLRGRTRRGVLLLFLGSHPSFVLVQRLIDQGWVTTLQVWLGGYVVLGAIVGARVAWEMTHGRPAFAWLRISAEPLPPLRSEPVRLPRERIMPRDLIAD
jgi:hypothetical protein